MKRTPLRRISKKQQERLRTYSTLRKQYLKEHPICELCKESHSTDIHHKAKRGKNLNNVDTWAALCRICHSRIENNKSWARENGWLENI